MRGWQSRPRGLHLRPPRIVVPRVLVALSLLTLYGVFHPFRHHDKVLPPKTHIDDVRVMAATSHRQPWSTGTDLTQPRLIGTDVTQRRPRFILHIGLPKTGTTFLQCSLCSQFNVSEPLLLKDNWVFLGTCPYHTCGLAELPDQFFLHRRSSFFDYGTPLNLNSKFKEFGPILHSKENLSSALRPERTTALRRIFTDVVNKMRTKRRNVMLIFEGLHILDDLQIRALASFITNDWDVSVLIAYRPLYSWLPSKYNSVTKKQGAYRRDWPSRTQVEAEKVHYSKPFDLENRGSFTEFVRRIESTQQHPAETCLRNFGKHFENVSVIALSKLPVPEPGVDPMLSYLLCSVANASYACKAIRSRLIGSNVASNPSVNYYNYDLLATAAYDAGLLKTAKLSRGDVRERIQVRQELVLNRTVHDFPLQCLPEQTLNRLERISLNAEKSLFKERWTQTDEDAHHLTFAKTASSKTSFCWIDTNRTLSDESWMSFLASLGLE